MVRIPSELFDQLRPHLHDQNATPVRFAAVKSPVLTVSFRYRAIVHVRGSRCIGIPPPLVPVPTRRKEACRLRTGARLMLIAGMFGRDRRYRCAQATCFPAQGFSMPVRGSWLEAPSHALSA